MSNMFLTACYAFFVASRLSYGAMKQIFCSVFRNYPSVKDSAAVGVSVAMDIHYEIYPRK